MLCVNNDRREYIDECRSSVAEQVAAYRRLVDATRDQAAIDAFEPHFFNNLVLALDSYFVHRARGIEKKDGNPLNEADFALLSSAFFAEIESKYV